MRCWLTLVVVVADVVCIVVVVRTVGERKCARKCTDLSPAELVNI